MTSLLGCHWQRQHPDRQDMPHVARMQYPSVKLFKNEWDNRDFSHELLTVLPRDAYILARDHALSEQKEDMWRNAVAAGTDHANQWVNKVQSGQYHLPIDRSFFLGINEPDATHGDRDKIDIYTATFLRTLNANGLRGGAFNFSTGHPRTVDGTPNTDADYSVFERSHRAIVEGNHIAVLHIYGTGAVPCAPGHYDRLKACTWQDVEWVVGEMGIDEHVIGGGAHVGFHGYFEGRLNDYCAWLDTLIMGINDPRIHSYQVFTYDHASPWETFDTHPIRDALESYDWQHVKQQPTHPTPAPNSPVAVPNKPRGANIRSGPGTEYPVEGAEAFGTPMPITGRNEGPNRWWQIDMPHIKGWVSNSVVDARNTDSVPVVDAVEQPAPAPDKPQPPSSTPSGIIDPRVAQAILAIESDGRTHGEGGKPIIRFEAHVFRHQMDYDDKWDDHFKVNDQQPWKDQQWRRSPGDPWRPIHTGKQADEYEAFEFAKSIDRDAAYQAISMGAGQLMGFNHDRIGYPSAEAMFDAFQSAPMQTIGFINYFLSDPALVDAMQRKDWREIAKRYNGASNVDVYAPLLEKAYKELA